jgi:hypothetical protein
MNNICDFGGSSQFLEAVIKHSIVWIIALERGFVLHVLDVFL